MDDAASLSPSVSYHRRYVRASQTLERAGVGVGRGSTSTTSNFYESDSEADGDDGGTNNRPEPGSRTSALTASTFNPESQAELERQRANADRDELREALEHEKSRYVALRRELKEVQTHLVRELAAERGRRQRAEAREQESYRRQKAFLELVGSSWKAKGSSASAASTAVDSDQSRGSHGKRGGAPAVMSGRAVAELRRLRALLVGGSAEEIVGGGDPSEPAEGDVGGSGGATSSNTGVSQKPVRIGLRGGGSDPTRERPSSQRDQLRDVDGRIEALRSILALR